MPCARKFGGGFKKKHELIFDMGWCLSERLDVDSRHRFSFQRPILLIQVALNFFKPKSETLTNRIQIIINFPFMQIVELTPQARICCVKFISNVNSPPMNPGFEVCGPNVGNRLLWKMQLRHHHPLKYPSSRWIWLIMCYAQLPQSHK